ncbi:putative regulatory subunit of protein kinase a-like protein [Trypanosoma rangeli]|uniref:Putative regulatory subunit of protein kinase a-like protein n=1 Tax=Trypanosoma rangeli TaxID=5698 RepID=A0A422MT09_TRYRA|nr:putative regulatory subunit of protein kinase a-like protein [Trypanosoma rangeli]RNE96339.1 putative regulatory subunit of protein kinase a-like protein [Trypanosoma rangeli]|eukprot:RNE96339.1 putative regulatory subunit of protein kinase a-like protein [Trypanosoma rangeli]
MAGEHHDTAASDAEENDAGAKFAFSEGTGAPLVQLPAVQAVGNRGAACKQLEARLESLHRLVFGRAGRAGERRRALEAFCGFPEAMRESISERVHKLKKDKLRGLIQALGMPVHISNAHAQVADGVTAFLMQPRVAEAKLRTPRKTSRPQKKAVKRGRAAASESAEPDVSLKRNVGPARTEDAEVKGTPKRTKKEVPVAERASSAQPPSDDAIRVAVYKRVLSTPREERSKLTTKALRLELEQLFGDLEARKAVIKESASECVSALVAAEEAASAVAAATTVSLSSAATVGTTAAVVGRNSGDHTVEPSPAPHPPQVVDSSTLGDSRSQAPPPRTPDGSIALHASVPTFPAHPSTTVPVVSIPPHLPAGEPVL